MIQNKLKPLFVNAILGGALKQGGHADVAADSVTGELKLRIVSDANEMTLK